MSTNTIAKTLQVAYPATIFLAVLASAGMRLVQAESSDIRLLFPNQGNSQNWTIAPTETKSCSDPKQTKLTDQPLTCSDAKSIEWTNRAHDDRQFVNNAAQKQHFQSL